MKHRTDSIVHTVGKHLNKIAAIWRKRVQVVFAWLRSKWRKAVFLFVQVIALILVILGWYLDHSSQTRWVVDTFAPKYTDASRLWEQMFKSLGSEFDSTTPGFSEISLLLSEHLAVEVPTLGEFSIAKIKVVGVTSMVVNPNPDLTGPRVTLQITLEDQRVLSQVEVPKRLLASDIQDRLLEEPLFRWGEGFQWWGIFITFATLILEKMLELV